ncbi:hypothetical protein DIPPA_54333 [Diplonema papillatum]|nr:hypothetical protein DIPPA_54333 [Diplonema papillatum]
MRLDIVLPQTLCVLQLSVRLLPAHLWNRKRAARSPRRKSRCLALPFSLLSFYVCRIFAAHTGVPRLVVSPLTGGVPRLRPGVDRVLLPRLQLVSGSRLFSIFGIKSGQRFCSRRIGGTLPSREAFAGKELTRLPLFTEPCIHGLQL